MEVCMKTVLLKTVFVAVIVIFAMLFVTCVPEIPESGDSGGNVEYTDVEYEIYGGVGNERVKSVKLYLDGVKVPVTAKQRAIHRALSLESARGSHDFFEVVFQYSGTVVARANWEIGSPAGISGVERGTTAAGIDYTPLYNATGPCSVVFVGMKLNKTLLGVGWLTHVNDNPHSTTNQVRNGVSSVTFTVAPLKTWVGFTALNTVKGKDTIYGADDDTTTTRIATFMTNAGGGASAALTGTTGNTMPFMNAAVNYPLYAVPAAPGSFLGTYSIGGLSGVPAPATGAAPASPTAGSLWPAVRIYGNRPTGEGGTGTAPLGGLQVIKRKPRFSYQGNRYEAGSIYDTKTDIIVTPTYYTTPTQASGSQFNPVIPLTITTKADSKGLFAFTFQAPVYAITQLEATNPGNLKFTKWFIRPADGPELYLLDDGNADGGMVMIGSMSDATDDWLIVKTTGIGFDND
jgi:hypothetical protein